MTGPVPTTASLAEAVTASGSTSNLHSGAATDEGASALSQAKTSQPGAGDPDTTPTKGVQRDAIGIGDLTDSLFQADAVEEAQGSRSGE